MADRGPLCGLHRSSVQRERSHDDRVIHISFSVLLYLKILGSCRPWGLVYFLVAAHMSEISNNLTAPPNMLYFA